MYLLDTNIISELRKRDRANPGITRFFRQMVEQEIITYLSVITTGELRRGVDIIRHRGDATQAKSLETWLQIIMLRTSLILAQKKLKSGADYGFPTLRMH